MLFRSRAYGMQLTTIPLFIFVPPVSPSFRTFAPEILNNQADGAKPQYDSLMSAQNAVLENANKAYMTAGMSANEYMDTVTGFSASLISSLGGDTNKAADYANSALVDMSDNANKMGTDMESIKNAYQGFAKQNYTMLDNLKLGYGGTQADRCTTRSLNVYYQSWIYVLPCPFSPMIFRMAQFLHKQHIGALSSTEEISCFVPLSKIRYHHILAFASADLSIAPSQWSTPPWKAWRK